MKGDLLPDVGDAAFVLRVCECGRNGHMRGVPVKVIAILEGSRVVCDVCDYLFGAAEVAITRDYSFLRAWLRKIPPLAELESVDLVAEVENEMPRRERVPA